MAQIVIRLMVCALAVLSPVLVVGAACWLIRAGSDLAHTDPPSGAVEQVEGSAADRYVDKPQPWLRPIQADLPGGDNGWAELNPFRSDFAHRWVLLSSELTGSPEPALLGINDDATAALLIERADHGDLHLSLLILEGLPGVQQVGLSMPSDIGSVVVIDGGLRWSRDVRQASGPYPPVGERLMLGPVGLALDLDQPKDGCYADSKPCVVRFDTVLLCSSQAISVGVGWASEDRQFIFDMRTAPRAAMSRLLSPGQACH